MMSTANTGRKGCTVALLWLALACISFCSGVEAMQTKFGGWEHCYYEDAAPWVRVNSAHVQIVQSRNHELGVQVWVDADLQQPMTNGTLRWNIWHEETGNRQKFPKQSACCGLLADSACRQSGQSDCPLGEGNVLLMQESLVDEIPGHYEVAFTLYAADVLKATSQAAASQEEAICLLVKYRLDEKDLAVFAEQRAEKLRQPLLQL